MVLYVSKRVLRCTNFSTDFQHSNIDAGSFSQGFPNSKIKQPRIYFYQSLYLY